MDMERPCRNRGSGTRIPLCIPLVESPVQHEASPTRLARVASRGFAWHGWRVRCGRGPRTHRRHAGADRGPPRAAECGVDGVQDAGVGVRVALRGSFAIYRSAGGAAGAGCLGLGAELEVELAEPDDVGRADALHPAAMQDTPCGCSPPCRNARHSVRMPSTLPPTLARLTATPRRRAQATAPLPHLVAVQTNYCNRYAASRPRSLLAKPTLN
jgi:hypothetical protein